MGQIATTRRTTGNQSTGHSSESTLAYNRSGIQLQCYENAQFANKGNTLFQITGQKMFNKNGTKGGGDISMAGDVKQKKTKNAT